MWKVRYQEVRRLTRILASIPHVDQLCVRLWLNFMPRFESLFKKEIEPELNDRRSLVDWLNTGSKPASRWLSVPRC
ncbi:hypothetical protein VTO42DRAFT_456 [Malbranchea cinnamomea]